MSENIDPRFTDWVEKDVSSDVKELLRAQPWPWPEAALAGLPAPAARKKVKEMVRRGVPSEHRKQLWIAAVGAERFLRDSPSLYSDTVKDLFGRFTHTRTCSVPTIAIDHADI